MIYGNINSKHFEQELAILPRPLQNAIRFLKDNDLANHEPGRFDLDFEGVPVILQVLDLTTAPRETLRPEIHRKNITKKIQQNKRENREIPREEVGKNGYGSSG